MFIERWASFFFFFGRGGRRNRGSDRVDEAVWGASAKSNPYLFAVQTPFLCELLCVQQLGFKQNC